MTMFRSIAYEIGPELVVDGISVPVAGGWTGFVKCCWVLVKMGMVTPPVVIGSVPWAAAVITSTVKAKYVFIPGMITWRDKRSSSHTA